ncbi:MULTISPECIES: hypothetical protein [unclassified Pantoea]|uniref:hypothetical protein n=1 Tax=unclassified Pantoea TaxID=2630326 RepID=UPI00301D523B
MTKNALYRAVHVLPLIIWIGHMVVWLKLGNTYSELPAYYWNSFRLNLLIAPLAFIPFLWQAYRIKPGVHRFTLDLKISIGLMIIVPACALVISAFISAWKGELIFYFGPISLMFSVAFGLFGCAIHNIENLTGKLLNRMHKK